MSREKSKERRTGKFRNKRLRFGRSGRTGGRSLRKILVGVDDGSITVEQAVEELDRLEKSRTTRVERFFNALVT